jgi:protease I
VAKILIVLPQTDFDPTEVAVPWHVLSTHEHEVVFATQTGRAAACDAITLTGVGLPFFLKFLQARPENRALYHEMEGSEAFQRPLTWNSVNPLEFDGLILPGGHASGMRPYIDACEVQAICLAFFDRTVPVGAICHGVMALARAIGPDGKSALFGYETTGLTNKQEKPAIALTKPFMGDHYQTFPKTVQDDVSAVLRHPQDFKTGPNSLSYGTAKSTDVGFVHQDRHYISARWPGDAWKFATRFAGMLKS